MSRNTQFKRTPTGAKTPKMIEVEGRIGRSLEEDYTELYLNGPYGQKRLANRWGVKKTQILSAQCAAVGAAGCKYSIYRVSPTVKLKRQTHHPKSRVSFAALLTSR